MNTINPRTIKEVIHAKPINMNGHLLDQPLPYNAIKSIDPFLLIHHWNQPLSGGLRQKEVGVGPHPHRGFSPVTFVYKGDVEHRDSLGHKEIVAGGGTQWMHAGKGITHSERPSAKLAREGGENEFIQFWVNTPAKHKMDPPYYLPISNEDTPVVIQHDARVQVVAGSYKDVTGPAKTYSPQVLLRVETEEESKILIPLPPSFNTLIYILNGSLVVNDRAVSDKDMVWFHNDGDIVEITTTSESRFIVLAGEPIGEKVSQYGPFVMNTETEILEAIRDAQMGKMGILIEDF